MNKGIDGDDKIGLEGTSMEGDPSSNRPTEPRKRRDVVYQISAFSQPFLLRSVAKRLRFTPNRRGLTLLNHATQGDANALA